MTGKIEEELKMLSNNYTEKNLALAATQRRKQVNVSTSEFEDFLTPEKVAKLDILDTEHLLTVMVVIGRGMEAGTSSSTIHLYL